MTLRSRNTYGTLALGANTSLRSVLHSTENPHISINNLLILLDSLKIV